VAAKVFYKQLPAHISRLRLTTFDQLADYLLDSRYTQDRYPNHARQERRKFARADAAHALRQAEQSGYLIQDENRPSGIFDRAELLFDNSVEAEIQTSHFQQLVFNWHKVGRQKTTLILLRREVGAMTCAAKELGANPNTAELVLSLIYFGLSPVAMESWRSTSETHTAKIEHAYTARAEMPYVAAARYCEPMPVEVFSPVVRYWARTGEDPTEQNAFLTFFRGLLDERRADGTRIQIWIPDSDFVSH
jgi:hypothetical protein